MSFDPEIFDSTLASLRESVASLLPRLGTEQLRQRGARWCEEVEALRFHLFPRDSSPLVTALIGGTGTGKSTILNALLHGEISAVSFRRTFTGGPVAVVGSPDDLPEQWLGTPHRLHAPDDGPTRGVPGTVTLVPWRHPLLESHVFVDTPDLDGENLTHHREAERVFRWSEAILFLVTPEKYQMNELTPFYRLAYRYRLPCLFVMNKCNHEEIAEDYRRQPAVSGFGETRWYRIPRHRDRSGLAGSLEPLGKDLGDILRRNPEERKEGLRIRVLDCLNRFQNRVLSPLRHEREEVSGLIKTLRLLKTPSPAVSVDPLTEELQQRLREKSVLYLAGPRRVYDRLRTAYSMLYRRTRAGDPDNLRGTERTGRGGAPEDAFPDFPGILADQFRSAQVEMEDLIRSCRTSRAWLETNREEFERIRIPAEEAARIAEKEIHDLKNWLQAHWDAEPRDTRLLRHLASAIPGGRKILRWSEAAPYLLILVCAARGAIFGPVDWLILGGYSLAAWLGEHLSNEVAAKVRTTNRRILQGYSNLVRKQIERHTAWLEDRIPSEREIARLEKQASFIRKRMVTRTETDVRNPDDG